MLHRISATGKFRFTLESLQQTGVDLLEAVAAASPGDTATAVVMTLEQLQTGFGAWLAAKDKIVVERVQALQTLKAQNNALFEHVVRVVKNDLGFATGNPTTFEFLWKTLPDEVKTLVGGLFLDLFEVLLGQGDFRQNRFGEVGKYGKGQLVGSFLEVHPDNQLVCPACDCRNTPYIPDLPQAHDDLDHYLPKSKYPLLAVSPDNLVPVCLPCNSRFKGEYDPLTGLAAGGLDCVFLPYARPAIDEITVKFEFKSTDVCPNLTTIVSTASDAKADERVNRLNKGLHLHKRWRVEIIELDKQLGRMIRTWADGPLPAGGWTEAYLRTRLQDYLQSILVDVGKSPFYFLYTCFIKWAIKDYVPLLLSRINRQLSA